MLDLSQNKVNDFHFKPITIKNPDVNIKDLKHFADKIHNEKLQMLDNSYKEVKCLTKELENLKLQNEELEITIQSMVKEKYHLEELYDQIKNSFTLLSEKYNATRDLLQMSHDQNLKLDEIIEKIRRNEKCLISESQRSRRVGSTEAFNDIQTTVNMKMIENLETQVKFWQQKAEKLNNIINLQDQALPQPIFENEHSGNIKKNRKKTTNDSKRYNKVVVRSHTLENAQWKSKENEFEKLKMEKEQLKRLLTALESQISEIQKNVMKINDEKEKYKELYFDIKEKFDQSEKKVSLLDSQFEERTKENVRIVSENGKHCENINILLKDNKHHQSINQNLTKEIEHLKSEHETTLKSAQSKVDDLISENRDLALRSNNLKININNIECEFSTLEVEFHRKLQQMKDQCEIIENLKAQLEYKEKELKQKDEQIEKVNESFNKCRKDSKSFRKNEENLENKLEIKAKECQTLENKIREKEEDINKLKISYQALMTKFENHSQSSDQTISSKMKLICSLELRIENIDKDSKLKDDEIVQLRNQIYSKCQECEGLIQKYEESQDSKRYLQQHIDNLSINVNQNNGEIVCLNKTISELTTVLEKLKEEVILQKSIVKQKDDQIMCLNIDKSKIENELKMKDDEIFKNKRIIANIHSDAEQKESHLQSALQLIEMKDCKISSMQQVADNNELKIKDCAKRLGNVDDSIDQYVNRISVMEKEIHNLQTANSRLTKQKNQLSYVLSLKNKEVGHLQAKLGNVDNPDGSSRHNQYSQYYRDESMLQDGIFHRTCSAIVHR